MQRHTKTGTKNAGSFFAAIADVYKFQLDLVLYSFFEYNCKGFI